MSARHSRTDYRQALQRLMPRGRAWPQDPQAVQTLVLDGLGGSFERTDAAGQFLLADAFPLTAVGLLAEWEASLGLPDPCAGELATLQQRQGQVVARLTDAGGLAAADYIAYAADLGFAITIQSFAPFMIGQAGPGMPLMSDESIFTWAVTAPTDSPVPFRIGLSGTGEALLTWGNAVLECELTAIAPAHADPVFLYEEA